MIEEHHEYVVDDKCLFGDDVKQLRQINGSLLKKEGHTKICTIC
jgi:hypothetical protein